MCIQSKDTYTACGHSVNHYYNSHCHCQILVGKEYYVAGACGRCGGRTWTLSPAATSPVFPSLEQIVMGLNSESDVRAPTKQTDNARTKGVGFFDDYRC